MAQTAFETKLLRHVVKQTLYDLTETWSSENCAARRTNKGTGCNHVDVTVAKKAGKLHFVRITNYGRYAACILQLIRKSFEIFIAGRTLPGNILLARIYSRSELDEEEHVHDLYYSENSLSVRDGENPERFIVFPCWKNYLSLELEHTLSDDDADSLKEFTTNEMRSLQANHSKIKFTYHHGEELLYNNHVQLDKDYKSCETVSAALTSVIRQSLNNEFRQRCFAALGIRNSHRAQAAFMLKLLPMIHYNYVLPDETDDI